MSKLMLHAGGKEVTLEDLRAVDLPEVTRTYIPVSHYDLALNLGNVAKEILTPKGYVFQKTQFALGKDGQRMFGIYQFRNGGPDMGLCVAFRNSYDKSMSAGIAIGAQVFVCDNLAFSGEIVVMRKHTANVIEVLRNDMITSIFQGVTNYEFVHKALDHYRTIDISERDGYEILGTLAGEEVLTPTETNEAFRQWREPEYEEFKPRNAYSLYNAGTCALRMAPIHRTIEAHNGLHRLFAEYFPSNN